MAKSVALAFKGLDQRIYQMAVGLTWEGADRIMNAIPTDWRSKFTVIKNNTGAYIQTGSELVAYLEFGTGDHARRYLATQEKEVGEEAIKFYINGKGRMPARPHLFPAYYRTKKWVEEQLELRLQKILNKL